MQDHKEPKRDASLAPKPPSETKEERLAKALRDNLKRRKAKKD